MIDYRSDTVTRPSAAMRKAMASAEVGDDVLREDPTVLELERRAAALTGKEAALFVPSGTFGNQLALFTWARRGDEAYLNENAHIVQHEAGASAVISGVFLRPIAPAAPWLAWSDVAPRLRVSRDVHFPPSALVCLENALSDGTVQPLDSMAGVRGGADAAGLPVHLDGARLFNAALALGVSGRDVAAAADSVMFCLSKGLGAPVGSVLCGPRDFVAEALFKRKIMGGGMRQAGVLAAAGLVALDEELPRLAEDHAKAALLASAFAALDAFRVKNPEPAINMVFLALAEGGPAREALFLELLAAEGVLTYPAEGGVFRFVTHRDVRFEDVEKTTAALVRVAEGLRASSRA